MMGWDLHPPEFASVRTSLGARRYNAISKIYKFQLFINHVLTIKAMSVLLSSAPSSSPYMAISLVCAVGW